jgi:RHS repeat-associated protein
LRETLYPDGTRKAQALQWAGYENTPVWAKYYTFTQTSGQSPVYTWFDDYGREVCNQTYGLNNQRISIYTEYDYSTGRKKRVSEPKFDTESKIWAETYTYDTYRRLSSIITPYDTTSYIYNGLATTITTPEGSRTTMLNASGQTQSETVNGKAVTYSYYASGLPHTSTPQDGLPVTMEYNLQGKRTKLTDPDAGTISTKYNGFGELLWEKQNIHSATDSVVTIHHYFPQTGLLQSVVRHGNQTDSTVYTYDTDLGHPGRIKSIEMPGQHKQSFTYDALGRTVNVREEIDGKDFNHFTEYDVFGRIKKETFPAGYCTINKYDKNGNLTQVTDRSNRNIWQAVSENAYRQLTAESRGGITTFYAFDNRHQPTGIAADNNLLNHSYSFNSNGNLEYRVDNITGYKEMFSYDNLNRLTYWDIYLNNSLQQQNSLTYDAASGNITSKGSIGDYTMSYGANGKPHALTSISGMLDNFLTNNLNVTYTDFKKIKTLSEGDKFYELTYGIDEQRRKSVYKLNNIPQYTRYYMGNYEELTGNLGNTKKIHYLHGGAILIQENNTETMYYAYSDYQGSLIALANENGTVVEHYAYDPWGNRRNPADWTQADTRTSFILNRGYTGHEHLDAFGIINMNGRVYDPLTASFFSPDPYIQSPGNWLNYNRYAYCLNNPMKYTDPSGEWWGIDDLIAGAAGFLFGYVSHGLTTGNWGWNAVAAGGIGAASAWLGYNTCGLGNAAWAPGQGITSSTWNYVGSMAFNTAAGQIIPSMNIPIGNHFGLSVSPAFGLGASGLTAGMNLTGAYRNGDFGLAAGIGAGDNYWGWNASFDVGGYGGGYGQTTYAASEVMGHQLEMQRVGTYTALWEEGSFSISNDLWGDRRDRWRTSAAELNIGKFSVGTYLYTNWGESDSRNMTDKSENCKPPKFLGIFNSRNKNEGLSTWTNGRPYFAPLWVGYRNGNQITRIGISRQWVHNNTQNWVHQGFGKANYYMSYDEFKRGTYFYTGYRNPLSLWDR